jgi:hypothetical protein
MKECKGVAKGECGEYLENSMRNRKN